MKIEVKSNSKTSAITAYILLGLGIISMGITGIIALIIAHIEGKAYEDKDPLLADHFRFIKRTGWYAILWSTISIILSFVVVGFFTLFVTILWALYRCVKGYCALGRNEFMYGEPLPSSE